MKTNNVMVPALTPAMVDALTADLGELMREEILQATGDNIPLPLNLGERGKTTFVADLALLWAYSEEDLFAAKSWASNALWTYGMVYHPQVVINHAATLAAVRVIMEEREGNIIPSQEGEMRAFRYSTLCRKVRGNPAGRKPRNFRRDTIRQAETEVSDEE